MSDLDCEDPRVKYQKHENGVWYNESLNLRSYLFNVAAWQILHTMNITAHIKIRNEKNLEKIIGDSLFFIGEDRSVRLGSNYLTCQNAEKNILVVFNRLNGYLHFGADNEGTLTDDAPQTKTNQTAVLKQRISRPPPCLLPLHILRPAGVLLPLFLPQDIVNAPADLLGFPGSDRCARCGCRASP